jgi:hypothetical protein
MRAVVAMRLVFGMLLVVGLTIDCSSAAAQNDSLRVAMQPRKRAGAGKVRVIEKNDAGRNDVEGAIWQFTATQNNGKDKQINGEFRIKGRAIYAPAEDFYDGNSKATKKSTKRVTEEPPPKGEKRVGDVIVNERSGGGEMQLVFTHYKKLTGRAVVKRQANSRSTANLAGYLQGKDGKRWKFELRRAED